ncbi:MAG: hypothetical protein EOO61_17435 [Hymenobacter sp.]|nr:MAG: hypothetical protein EOO61_17435 [Hymenobacter sp.]
MNPNGINEFQLWSLIDQLQDNIVQLKEEAKTSQRTIEKLQRDRQEIRKDLVLKERELKKLEKKLADSKKKLPKSKEFGKIVGNNLSATDSNAELKQQLDEYIRTLDRCITHWSNLS